MPNAKINIPFTEGYTGISTITAPNVPASAGELAPNSNVVTDGAGNLTTGGGPAPPPSGDPNTQAYFGAGPGGVLTDDVNATMSLSDWQLMDGGGVNAAHVDRALRSTALGSGSVASGSDSFASGLTCVASGDRCHAEGINTTAGPESQAHAEGNGSQATGQSSHAEGQFTIAANFAAHAEGNNSQANGQHSHAEGNGSIAGGDFSHCEGSGCVATGPVCHAEGQATNATGFQAHSEGRATTSSGDATHAEGLQTFASTTGSHSEGIQSNASAPGAHAEGFQTVASDANAHAEGESTQATAPGAHAEGLNTLASAQHSHAQGRHTTASADTAHAEGTLTVASGRYSRASGLGSKGSLTGQRAHSSGPGGTTIDVSVTPGAIQESVLTMAAETPGGGAGESVELSLGDAVEQLTFEQHKGYALSLLAIARGLIAGVPLVRVFRQTLAIRTNDAGAIVSTLAAAGVQESIGDAGAATWTLTPTIGAGPDRLVLTFTTGATTAEVRVNAKIDLVEILLAAP